MAARRGRWAWLLFVALVVVPLAEIYVLIQVGQVIGAWWTILLLVADSILGSWLIKREGARAWQALRDALSSGRMPARELADGGLILPFTRPLARRLLTGLVARRLLGGTGGNVRRPGPGPEGPVVRGEVVDE